jgi:hypothetical protein
LVAAFWAGVGLEAFTVWVGLLGWPESTAC